MKFDYIKCPLNKYTFTIKPVREWVESQCCETTLNLFAGEVKLSVNEMKLEMI